MNYHVICDITDELSDYLIDSIKALPWLKHKLLNDV